MDQPPKHSPADVDNSAQSDSDLVIDDSSKTAFEDPNGFTTDVTQPSEQKASSRSRRRLYCFECNRDETHSLLAQRRWFYSFLLGLTFGTINIIGPYQCQCCGAKRLMCANSLNPRFWLRSVHHKNLAKSKKRNR